MLTTTAAEDAIQTPITSDQALKIARLQAEKIYRDLSAYCVFLELDHDGWHADYELKNRHAQGGGAHYVIDVQTGAIRTKKYEQ